VSFCPVDGKQTLTLGACAKKSPERRETTLKRTFHLFPVWQERQNQRAETLSGGKRYMLAIARG